MHQHVHNKSYGSQFFHVHTVIVCIWCTHTCLICVSYEMWYNGFFPLLAELEIHFTNNSPVVEGDNVTVYFNSTAPLDSAVCQIIDQQASLIEDCKQYSVHQSSIHPYIWFCFNVLYYEFASAQRCHMCRHQWLCWVHRCTLKECEKSPRLRSNSNCWQCQCHLGEDVLYRLDSIMQCIILCTHELDTAITSTPVLYISIISQKRF